jgi:hypothetical protein
MFARTFRTIRRSVAPRWLTDGEGGLVGYALDLMKDALAQRTYLGLLARLPQNDPLGLTTAPPDALVQMSRDRRVFRGIFDTDQQFAVKLRNWRTPRRTAGAAFTLLSQLHAYVGTASGVSFRTVDNSGNWYARSAAGVETSSLAMGNWNWDGDTAAWSRFWVIIYPGTLWPVTTQRWGTTGAVWGSAPNLWGSTAITPEQVVTLQAIVNDYKPAGTTCVSIILASDLASFNPASPEPDGLWGRPHKIVGGVVVPSRLTTARYLEGV